MQKKKIDEQSNIATKKLDKLLMKRENNFFILFKVCSVKIDDRLALQKLQQNLAKKLYTSLVIKRIFCFLLFCFIVYSKDFLTGRL